jgi:hypothetical protein
VENQEMSLHLQKEAERKELLEEKEDNSKRSIWTDRSLLKIFMSLKVS